jgi:hypothetical protein
MKKILLSMSTVAAAFVLSGCGADNQAYLQAQTAAHERYLQSYEKADTGKVEFEGTFEGKITLVEAKELPQMLKIQQPKSVGEVALDWARILVPTLGTVAGFHYNYMSQDSANKYNSENIASWTGNFQNSVSDTSVTNTTTDTTDTSVTNTTDTSTTSTTTDTSTTSTTEPFNYTDGTVTITNP